MKKNNYTWFLLAMIGLVGSVARGSSVDIAKAIGQYSANAKLVRALRNSDPLFKHTTCLEDVSSAIYLESLGSLAVICLLNNKKYSTPFGCTMKNLAINRVWYGGEVEQIAKSGHTTLGSVVHNASFVAVDLSVGKAANMLGEFDSVKKITQGMPEEQREFVYKNGKMVFVSGVAQGARILANEGPVGINADNGVRFAKDAFVQVGAYGMKQFVIDPYADIFFGKEDGFWKDVTCLLTHSVVSGALGAAVNKF